VAANEDGLQGAYAGSGYRIAADQVRGDLTFVMTGGTERFLSATGTGPVCFIETPDEPTLAGAKISCHLDGTINY
jgi:hypothetical protein